MTEKCNSNIKTNYSLNRDISGRAISPYVCINITTFWAPCDNMSVCGCSKFNQASILKYPLNSFCRFQIVSVFTNCYSVDTMEHIGVACHVETSVFFPDVV